MSFICVILVLVGGVMIYASTVLLGDLKTTTITKDKTELGISEETKSEAGITNIALFGVDARDYDGGTFAGRSDAIMVMSIDNVHHKVKLTSIMRDVRVYMGDGSPLPTFAGEPMEVRVPSPEEVWAALNADNKVSLYANVNGEVKLFNKN